MNISKVNKRWFQHYGSGQIDQTFVEKAFVFSKKLSRISRYCISTESCLKEASGNCESQRPFEAQNAQVVQNLKELLLDLAQKFSISQCQKPKGETFCEF